MYTYIYILFYLFHRENFETQSINVTDMCGGILRSTQGTLSSPDYPHSYSKKENCGWWIIGPQDHTLKIQFRDLHLPTRRNCKTADYVEISEQIPGNKSGTLIIKYLQVFLMKSIVMFIINLTINC